MTHSTPQRHNAAQLRAPAMRRILGADARLAANDETGEHLCGGVCRRSVCEGHCPFYTAPMPPIRQRGPRRPEDADVGDYHTTKHMPANPVLLPPHHPTCPECDGARGAHWGGCSRAFLEHGLPQPGDHFGVMPRG